MIYLAKTRVSVETEQRMTRMLLDTRLLTELTKPEIRAIYSEIEAVRDRLSNLLDRCDGK
jgi:hypothetical protein